MKRSLLVIATLVSLVALFLPTTMSSAWAEEGESSLQDGPTVRRLMLLRSNRFELQPLVAFSINDPFVRNIAAGVSANYYFNNSLGVGVDFAYALVHMDTDETKAIQDPSYRDRVRTQLSLAELKMAFDAGAIWAPMIGKFAVFGMVLNYDLHLFGGIGALMMGNRCASADDNACGAELAGNLEGIKLAGAVGLGTRIFFGNFMAVNFELRDYLASYSEYARGANDDNAEFQNFFMGSVGLSFFLPFDVYLSR